jgi:hypothetical protein
MRGVGTAVALPLTESILDAAILQYAGLSGRKRRSIGTYASQRQVAREAGRLCDGQLGARLLCDEVSATSGATDNGAMYLQHRLAKEKRLR